MTEKHGKRELPRSGVRKSAEYPSTLATHHCRCLSVCESFVRGVWMRTLGTLRNDDDDGNENVISKCNFSFL